jgi:hypothetical protein
VCAGSNLREQLTTVKFFCLDDFGLDEVPGEVLKRTLN